MLDQVAEWVRYYSVLHTAAARRDALAHLSSLAAQGGTVARLAAAEIKKIG